MKKPFRIVAALLGLVLAMGIFAACGGSKNFNTDLGPERRTREKNHVSRFVAGISRSRRQKVVRL